MKKPTFDQVKGILREKGYGDIFYNKNTVCKNNTISGEIPVEFLYKIVSNPEVLRIVRKVFQDKNYVPSVVCNRKIDSDIILTILREIEAAGLIKDAYDAPEEVSNLALIGIRSKVFGGLFDDLLIALTEDGSVFEVFEACTDHDLRKVIGSATGEYPVCIKPGRYDGLFFFAPETGLNASVFSQRVPIDLYSIYNGVEGSYNYEPATSGGFDLMIGAGYVEASNKETLVGRYAVELKYYNDIERLLGAVRKYLTLYNPGLIDLGQDAPDFLERSRSFTYLLLEEEDFPG